MSSTDTPDDSRKKTEPDDYVPWGTPGNISETLNEDQQRADGTPIRTPLVPEEFDDRDPRARRRADTHGLDWPEVFPIRERAIALLIGAVATMLVLLTGKGYGLAWDEGYYYQPSIDAAGWIARLLTREPGWASAASVDQGFGRIWELPPFVKLLQGISWAAFSTKLGELRALRLPSAALFGLSTALVYALGWLAARRIAALAAALAFITMPQVFGHAHFAASETATTFTLLLAVYCSLRGLRGGLWAVIAALAIALAFATKINAVFLPVILLPWALIHARKQSAPILFASILLTPVALFLFWPWLWHDPLTKLTTYIQFATEHAKIGVYFLGRKWNFVDDPVPAYYPLVMLLVSTPPATILAAAAGILLMLVRPTRTGALPWLFLWAVIVFIGAASLPNTPRYDGVRLFMPAMPFLALLAGVAVAWISASTQRIRRYAVNARAVAFSLMGILSLAGAIDIARAHPNELSYFSPLIGGLEGAQRRGFEVTYWAESLDRAALDELNKILPRGARVKTLALQDINLAILQQWGWIRPDIRFNDDVPPDEPYDYHLMQNRRGFWGRAESYVAANYQPMAVWGKGTVPFVMLYHTPGGLGTPRPSATRK